jgi:cupin fold WbuC family metalloprotein
MTGAKKLNDEVFVAEGPVVKVDADSLNRLKAQAAVNPRRRARLCSHQDTSDRLHEMFIVMAQGIYVRPHKHLKKTEAFHVIDGSATIVLFDDSGGIDDVFRISDHKSGTTFYFRSDDARYHTQLITSEFLVVHEITTGPFNRDETIFAPWAPPEEDTAAVKHYLENLGNAAAAFR